MKELRKGLCMGLGLVGFDRVCFRGGLGELISFKCLLYKLLCPFCIFKIGFVFSKQYLFG